jgi:acyl-CoA thioester hydrolase
LIENIPRAEFPDEFPDCALSLAMPTDPTKTDMPITLVPQDLSAIGYVVTAAYLNWVQAVVIKHWEPFAPEAAQASTFWIAIRHVITHHAAGRAGDSLAASTWIERSKGTRALFVTTISCGKTALAQVESTWVCLDGAAKRPKAIHPEVARCFA